MFFDCNIAGNGLVQIEVQSEQKLSTTSSEQPAQPLLV